MNKVKKMLCIVLALAMMIIPLSVGVNAAPADGYRVALHLDTENTTVARGDTITLSLTVDVDSWDSLWGLPCFYLMYNTDVFAPNADFKTDKTTLRMPMGDFGEYVVEENGINNTITTSNYNAVKNKFATSGESADDYTGGVMMTFAVDNDAGYTTAGGIQYTDADTVQIEFYLDVAEDAALGTYKVGLPYAAYLANKAYFNCNDTGKAVRVASSAIDASDAFVEITVAEAGDPEVALKFSDVKNQIRFDKTADGKYANTFDGRMVVSIDNLADVVGADVNLASVQAKIKEIGFLYAKNGAINADTALAQIKGGAATYSVATGGGYISTGFAEADYAVTGIIHNIPDADKTTAVSGAVYAIYDSNGDGVDEYTVYVLNGGETFTFEDLYSRNFNTAFPA